jgi:hypothetical protein
MNTMGKVVKDKGKETVPKARPKVKKAENLGRVYQLKISLIGSKPEIWRQILVLGDTTLAKLHNIIQELIGWEDDHLHEFVIAGGHYTRPHPDDLVPSQDEKQIRLYEVAPKKGLKFLYTYDFGDEWEHEIIVENILEEDSRFTGKPVCIGGENAGPPEDIGGIPGYYETLKAVKNPRHPDHEGLKEWLGEFDPKAFNIDLVNRILSKIR